MKTTKVITVIAGLAEDKAFSNCCFIADSLSQQLPNFSVKKIIRNLSEWKDWLAMKCKNNRWHHTKSPLIWRETGVSRGSSSYIGGNLEFQNFIKDHYGFEVNLSISDQRAINLDYLLVQNDETKSNEKKENAFHIILSGAGRSVCPDLVAELAHIKRIGKNGIHISLYDTPGHYFKLEDIVRDAIGIGGELCSIQILENLSDELEHCNILIVLDHIPREDQESIQEWLQRNYEVMKDLAKQINNHAALDMKVIFCSTGPTCFCANVLVKETKLNKHSILAISAHYGLEIMYDLVKSLGISNQDIGCPPVWGFLGISQYVDFYHAIHKHSVCMPKGQNVTSNKDIIYTLSAKCEEFRFLLYLAHSCKPNEKLAVQKAKCLYQVGRTEDFQKCKAICDLIKLWYKKSEAGLMNEIISLGISSDGTFDIPCGLFFSQPVQLKVCEDNSRIWVPCSEFPLAMDDQILKNCVETAALLSKDMKLID